MTRVPLAVLCVFLTVIPNAGAQTPVPPPPSRANAHTMEQRSTGRFDRFTMNYREVTVPPVNLANSNRIDSLLRAGRLYLSLQDALALALENNLDIELQRYGPQIADADILRAKAGGLLRGVPTGVTAGPGGAAGQTGQATGITQTAGQQAGATTGTVISQTGSTIPNLDPVLTGRLSWAHTSVPQTAAFVTGTNAFINRNDLANFNIGQSFLTGTSINFGYANSRAHSNSLRADFNPSNSGSASLNITQKLLQGFGRAVNNRNIVVARNQREISDLVFKQQVITTVSAITNLYWDLVSFGEDVKVRRQALELNQKLYEDNKKQVEIGTLAPIEIVRAEAEVARAQQDLTISETQVLQQETILKSALSRTGVASPAIASARVVPTDRINMPEKEAIEPVQDIVTTALSARPEIAQRRIQVENTKIGLRGSKSQLLPTVDGFINMANNGLAGEVNPLPLPGAAPGFPPVPRAPTAFFVGGYGTVLTQLFARNFPDYSAGFTLNIPLRNRAAQSDMIRDQLAVRQQEIGLQQLENQIRVDVQNALIGLQQARARYQAATKARVLQEQTLDAEQKKYALGASTIFNVILVQRDLAQAQSAEVAALSNYSKARVEFDRATGQTLPHSSVTVDEAFKGSVARPPSPLPATDPK
ncbi:MAG: TolC family protein [Bryobacterales bacterium]|nr:TolC family protein [Bryobacterales bacterium]